MESSTGSNSIDKPWDHAWSTEEMRKNRRDWSLAADSGLLKHLQQFSENLTKKANETQSAIESMTSQLNQTAILVDNITNTSLALANSQFIESRVQEDNIEIEQPPEDIKIKEVEQELSATDLLVSVCDSIREGLKIMDEKYEKVEVIASDSEDYDEDDIALPSVILRPKDPYQDRPLPYVIGSEQWKASSKVGLESSTSESEQEDEEESASDTDNKNIPNVLSSNPRTNLGIGRMSSTSSESNDYNIESNSIKDTDKSRLYARSQDTLNSDTEPATPSSVLPKAQNVYNASPSFAEELAKRLGSVMPTQRNVMLPDANDQVTSRSKDDIFNPEEDQNDVFSNKSDNLFSKGKNLFSDEDPSSSWKNKPARPVNKNIIPASIDVPPPLSNISSAPKSTIDDLFGDPEDSDDSDDIFSNKASKNIFASEREAVKSDVAKKQHLNVENVHNTSTMTTSTPEMNDKGRGLFEDDDDDDDLFKTVAKERTPDTFASAKKKPVGGVSIFGKVDILSSSKFRRPSSSSSSSSGSDENDHPRASSSSNPANATLSPIASSKSNNGSTSINNVFSPPEAGNNAAANSGTISNSSGSNIGNSSGISMQQPNIDNTAGSSLGADFQPLMTSSRLKSEEIYRERVLSDSLFGNKTRSDNSTVQQQQQQQQQRREQQQQDTTQVTEDASEDPEDVFGPPPLPKASDNSKSKSKVASLFDDSDSGDDLFASVSPSTRSQKSSERTPSRTAQPKTRSLFDDENDLFGAKDVPDVDLFGAAPVRSLSKVTDGLFDDVPPLNDDDDDLFANSKPKSSSVTSSLFGEVEVKDKLFADSVKQTKSDNLFEGEPKKKSSVVEGSSLPSEPVKTEPAAQIKTEQQQEIVSESKEPPKIEKPVEKKSSRGLFDESEDSDDSDLFGKVTKPLAADKSIGGLSSSSKGLFEDAEDSDLFGTTSKKSIAEKSSNSLFGEPSKPTSLFDNKTDKAPEQKITDKKESPEDIFDSGKSKLAKPKKLSTSIFDDSGDDDDDDDLFGSSKKASSSSLFNKESESSSAIKKMDEDKKVEVEKKEIENIEEKAVEKPPVPTKPAKTAEKKSIFSADDDDDDDDDLFGDKKKKAVGKSTPHVAEKKSEAKDTEIKTETIITTKPEVAPKNALFAEMRQKLEKQHRNEQSSKNGKTEPSVVDGAVISKKEPPKTLKIHTGLPISLPDESSSTSQAQPKKPAVSAKIKNLMGNMEGLKILSPTDTPPLFRKNNKEENNGNDDEQDTPGDLESSEASSPSLASGASSPHTSGSRARDSPSLRSDNTEGAISFDEPAQVETLTSIASKNRARLPAKRRPQSRQARQSALRQSGIDFDVPDVISNSPTNDQSNGDVQSVVDRLKVDGTHGGDDKSEISASRNTTTNLLSPSTDEEDLFDVPPDLPEDPAAKEDSLFGRAPILSPIERIERPKEKSLKKKEAKNKKEEEEEDVVDSHVKGGSKEEIKGKSRDEKKEEKVEAPIDPLRDDSHDPLKDPSQLFAFVTKTPSPEKNKGLILSEDDDSLFSSSSKTNTKAVETKTKPSLGLFDDDDDDASGSDLFSSSKTKIEKKPLKDSKIDLFDEANLEDDDDEDLFGSSKKKSEITEVREEPPPLEDKPEPKSAKSAAKDIFDNSSDDDDIFASNKKTIPKKKSTSLFDDDDDDDDDDIFSSSKPSPLQDSKVKVDSSRPVVKKAVTRDLKKTAEKIVEDPLSMLQED